MGFILIILCSLEHFRVALIIGSICFLYDDEMNREFCDYELPANRTHFCFLKITYTNITMIAPLKTPKMITDVSSIKPFFNMQSENVTVAREGEGSYLDFGYYYHIFQPVLKNTDDLGKMHFIFISNSEILQIFSNIMGLVKL